MRTYEIDEFEIVADQMFHNPCQTFMMIVWADRMFQSVRLHCSRCLLRREFKLSEIEKMGVSA